MSDSDGREAEPGFRRSFLEKDHFDKVIAVDGGLESAEALGITPDYIVGDFDTVSKEVTDRFQKSSVYCVGTA